MVIDHPTSARFIAAYMAFLGTLVSDGEKRGKSSSEWLVMGRARYAADRSQLETYRSAHPEMDAEMLDAIAAMQIDQWVYLKDTRSYFVLLAKDSSVAYAVLGLTERLRDVAQGESGVVLQTGLMPLNGRWVCDGLLKNMLLLGPNMRRDLTAAYQALRADGHFSLGPKYSHG